MKLLILVSVSFTYLIGHSSIAQLWVENGSDTTATDAPHATVSIDLLNDDVLLVIFDFCRLASEDKVPEAFKKQPGIGTGHVGGTSLRRFAKDDGFLSLPRHIA